jgi:hypothetical protein
MAYAAILTHPFLARAVKGLLVVGDPCLLGIAPVSIRSNANVDSSARPLSAGSVG